MQPIATIKLDTPDSSGTVRGVLCYDKERRGLLLFDPRVRYAEPVEADVVSDLRLDSLDEALQAVHDGWGADGGEMWDLQWLCGDPSDYDSE